MRTSRSGRLVSWVVVFGLPLLSTSAVTFTNNAIIGFHNTHYDEQPLVISNCTVAVDGVHAFTKLNVLRGGVLTHSSSPDGLLPDVFTVTNEEHQLTGTNAVLLNESNAVVSTVVVRDSSGLVTYSNGVDYVIAAMADNQATIQRTEASAIADGASVYLDYEVTNPPVAAGLNLSIAGDVSVVASGAIVADGKGYAGGQGPGAGGGAPNLSVSGAGAGYGGNGGMVSNSAPAGSAYGSFDQPVSLGSGGGPAYAGIGGAGGGAIKIVSAGTVTINGLVSANGEDATNSRSGGGSGGSVWIKAATLIGSGTIAANGGAGEPLHGGGGGGGRIAVESTTDNFSGTMTARGGSGTVNGGAGTVFQWVGQQGRLVVDNDGRAGAETPIAIQNATDVLIRGKAVVTPLGVWQVDDLTIASNGVVTTVYPNQMSVGAVGNIVIESGGMMTADSAGFPAGQGSGAGRFDGSLIGGGGGHGGYGANGSIALASGGNTYDSFFSPRLFGSGGGGGYPTDQGNLQSVGGAGGGVIQLTVKDVLRVNGRLSADGGDGSGLGGGGGAGGSIALTAGTLIGSGSITANGGNGVSMFGGGGGGGRIAVLSSASLFDGVIEAAGGGGFNWGGAGTVFVQSKGQQFSSQLILDNAGHSGTNTPLKSAQSSDLIVRNGAVGSVTYPASFANLILSSNGWLTAYSLNGVNFMFTGNATIGVGAGINVNETGYRAGQGPGAGHYSYANDQFLGSGAGHAGYGAGSASNGALGGNAYGSVDTPDAPGSGGGSSGPTGSGSVGGAGGGLVRLTVNGSLDLEGVITANGGNGSGPAGGGGSGGGVWLTIGNSIATTFTGDGSISVNGGAGAGMLGGGGGGGRIVVSCFNNSFSGTFSAHGGGGANRGGAGTILVTTTQQKSSSLLLDNGGGFGTNTPIDLRQSLTDLTVSGGAVGQWTLNGYSVRNLTIRTNGVMTTAASSSLQNINVSGNTVIDRGGALSVDGKGYPLGSGPGRGSSYAGSVAGAGGGGHGGFGAGDLPGYGDSYDSITAPTTAGSGGGVIGLPYGRPSSDGSGGGALRLTVDGLLLVNGRISADGSDGQWSGGGSGGSLWINAGTLSGYGVISANGGSGDGPAGGGAGGRVAITFTANTFAGFISACGGGRERGGAGTIYTRANNQSIGTVTVDNGGWAGTSTPLGNAFGIPPAPFNLVVNGGAVVYPQTPLPVLNQLTVGPGAVLTSLPGGSNLLLTVAGNAEVAYGGAVAVDGAGYAMEQGPGGGRMLSGSGSGGGYGGIGGASATGMPGGTNYGSPFQPTDFGSGGGRGSGLSAGGSTGGGSLRLIVAGWLNVDGNVTANGSPGLQDNAGGGAGGSVWISAGAFSGSGWISSDGGAGDLYGGGGGGGGRIRIDSPISAYEGFVSAAGGAGFAAGGTGSIVVTTNFPVLDVIGQSPTGIVGNPVSGVNLVFNSAVDDASFSAADVTLLTPNGPLEASNIVVTMTDPLQFHIGFPEQTAMGQYQLTVGPLINDVFGQPMAQPYTGTFSLSLPVSIALKVAGELQNTNLILSWQGSSGVIYQVFYSTNLTDWQLLGSPINGSGVNEEFPLPMAEDPMRFFRIEAQRDAP